MIGFIVMKSFLIVISCAPMRRIVLDNAVFVGLLYGYG